MNTNDTISTKTNRAKKMMLWFGMIYVFILKTYDEGNKALVGYFVAHNGSFIFKVFKLICQIITVKVFRSDTCDYFIIFRNPIITRSCHTKCYANKT